MHLYNLFIFLTKFMIVFPTIYITLNYIILLELLCVFLEPL